jgi:ornithine cyclodeaminase/alanine dehydrogenase-like protein (mu-crystallin family)
MKHKTMLSFSSGDMVAAIPLDRAIEVVERAFIEYGQGDIQLGGRLTVPIGNQGDSSLILPAIHAAKQYFGFKQSTTIFGNAEKGLPTVLSQYFLYRLPTGELLAMMDFQEMTNLKTGAAAAIATKHMARPDARMVGVIGSGTLAKSVLRAICQIKQIERVSVFDYSPEQAETFANYAVHELGVGCEIAPTSQACVRESDILCTCTTSHRPVLNGEDVPPGCHINAMGSYTPDMQELDPITVSRAGTIVTDIPEDAVKAAGDFASLEDSRDVIALDVIIRGQRRGRRSDHDITLYESIGFSVLDVALAVCAYESGAPAAQTTQ